MGRHANPDIRRAFAEFQDQETPSKCNKVRCRHCGYVRAKNTTRQIEHLQDCQAYLASSDAQGHLVAQQQQQQQQPLPLQPQPQPQPQQDGTPVESSIIAGPSQIFNGQQPNPNLQVQRRGPNTSKRPRDSQPMIAPKTIPVPMPSPSLTSHLLNVCAGPFRQAIQRPFLSHAGCGTLRSEPFLSWMVQDGHIARAYIRFVGQLMAKIRLPQLQKSQFHPMFRTLDLLISALNNMRREMQFYEITEIKYNLVLDNEPPTPVTRAMIDFLITASNSSASLLEGMVAMWSTEHIYRSAWQYSSNFLSSIPVPSDESHITALHQVLIPNWTSPAAYKFLDATRVLVDELANITTTRDGKEEMMRCEEVFRQACWLAERLWPNVDDNGGLVINNMQTGMPSGRPMTINRSGMHANMAAPSMHGPGVNMHGNAVNGNMATSSQNPNMHSHMGSTSGMNNNAKANVNPSGSSNLNNNNNNSNNNTNSSNNSNNNTNNTNNSNNNNNANNRSGPTPSGPINAGVRNDNASASDSRNNTHMSSRDSMDSSSQDQSP